MIHNVCVVVCSYNFKTYFNVGSIVICVVRCSSFLFVLFFLCTCHLLFFLGFRSSPLLCWWSYVSLFLFLLPMCPFGFAGRNEKWINGKSTPFSFNLFTFSFHSIFLFIHHFLSSDYNYVVIILHHTSNLLVHKFGN